MFYYEFMTGLSTLYCLLAVSSLPILASYIYYQIVPCVITFWCPLSVEVNGLAPLFSSLYSVPLCISCVILGS